MNECDLYFFVHLEFSTYRKKVKVTFPMGDIQTNNVFRY